MQEGIICCVVSSQTMLYGSTRLTTPSFCSICEIYCPFICQCWVTVTSSSLLATPILFQPACGHEAIARPHAVIKSYTTDVLSRGSGDSSVVRVPGSLLKGRGFESLQKRRENVSFLCFLISISVPPPCYCSST